MADDGWTDTEAALPASIDRGAFEDFLRSQGFTAKHLRDLSAGEFTVTHVYFHLHESPKRLGQYGEPLTQTVEVPLRGASDADQS